jgi:hypothetical protein
MTRLQPFAAQVRPTLGALGSAARTGRATLTSAEPQLRRLQRLTVPLTPVAQLTADLFQSTRDKGAVEGLLRFVYYATTAQARYDAVSHILPAFPMIKDTCNLYATTTVKGCDTHFAAGTTTAAAGQGTTDRGRGREAARTPAATTPAAGAVPSPPAAPARPDVLKDVPSTVGGIVDGLLGGLTGKGRVTAKPPAPSAPVPAPGPGSAQGLLDFLLGR